MSEMFLSASTVKELEKCTWKYWCKKHICLPDKGNSGSSRGTICHAILEFLLQDRRQEYVDLILSTGDVKSVKSIDRLIDKYIKDDIYLDKVDSKGVVNRELIDDMILVGLSNNYKREGEKLLSPETYFEINNENPRYKFRGFIDKLSEKDGKYYIVDYKTSSSHFTDEELKLEIQAAAYSLWALKQGKEASVEFVFLRFPKDPIRKVKYTAEELEGLEYYFADWQEYIDNIDVITAQAGMAADKGYPLEGEGFGGMVMCGYPQHPLQKRANGGGYYYCPYKFKMYYWVAVDEQGNIKKSFNFDEEHQASLFCDKNDLILEKRFYSGCPAHQSINAKIDNEWQLQK